VADLKKKLPEKIWKKFWKDFSWNAGPVSSNRERG
jgi:hypothetical protein